MEGGAGFFKGLNRSGSTRTKSTPKMLRKDADSAVVASYSQDVIHSALDLPMNLYVLRAPNAPLVRYVGCTVLSPDARVAQHCYVAVARAAWPEGQRPVSRWIRRLARAGMTPTIEVVSVMPARYAPAMERRLIQKVYAGPWLLNVTYNYWWTRRQTMVPRIGRWIPIRPKTRRQPTGRIWRPRP